LHIHSYEFILKLKAAITNDLYYLNNNHLKGLTMLNAEQQKAIAAGRYSWDDNDTWAEKWGSSLKSPGRGLICSHKNLCKKPQRDYDED